MFSNRPPKSLPPLLIRSNFTYAVINRVTEIKFLGVFFDQSLTFKKHINYLCQRLARISSLIYRVRDLMPLHIRKIMYHAHVFSILCYCNLIWANTYPSHLIPLIRQHKRIIRNVARADFFAHTEPLYKELKILDIDNIRKISLAIYFFKHRSDYEPPLQANHTYATRHRNRLRTPAHSHSLFQHSFLYHAPRYWNDIITLIPIIEIESMTKTTFKHRMKKMLLS